MTYGVKVFKNGHKVGYLKFDTGKTVFLNRRENREMEIKLRFAEETGRLKAEADLKK
jgi:hypothetical protein